MHTIWKRYCNSCLLLVLLFLTAGCNKIDILKIKVAVKHNVGKTIDFSMKMTDLQTNSLIDAVDALTTPITIVSQVASDICVDCLARYLHVAEDYVSQYNSDSISFIAIICKEKQKKVSEYITDLNPKKIRVLYDNDNQYLKEAHLMSIKNMWNAYLLDNQHRILLVGDPITQNNTKPFYTQYIKDWLEGKYSPKR